MSVQEMISWCVILTPMGPYHAKSAVFMKFAVATSVFNHSWHKWTHIHYMDCCIGDVKSKFFSSPCDKSCKIALNWNSYLCTVRQKQERVSLVGSKWFELGFCISWHICSVSKYMVWSNRFQTDCKMTLLIPAWNKGVAHGWMSLNVCVCVSFHLQFWCT